ncbi:MAG: ferritin [Gammaproteobacteria bacterium]|nr:ferritin [Gammaproteobacteria bacterium]
MKEKLVNLMQEQVTKEIWSGYLYLQIAEYYRHRGLDGFYEIFKKHFYEELEHAERFQDYLSENGIEVVLGQVDAPNLKFKDLREPLVFQLEHEKLVTSLINALYREAREEDDLATMHFLGWYIDEQMEEEREADGDLSFYDTFVDSKDGLLAMNKRMAKKAHKE